MSNQLTVLDCSNCGACCREMNAPPFYSHSGDDESWNVLPEHLKREVNERIDAICDTVPDGSPCCWLDLETMKCRHYEWRPDICRDFELGGEDCRRIRKHYSISETQA